MGKRRLVALAAISLAVLLTSSACGGAEAGSAEPGVITANNTEPQNPLIPSNTTEAGGGKVINAMFTGLVEFRTDGSTYEANASSIDTADNTTFTVHLEPGWTFHDGTPVTAESYVRAWNYAAYAPNGQSTASFFENIEGYDQVQSPPVGGEPPAKEMSGLEVVDDGTFRITLSHPFVSFPETLGYYAFSPLPDSFYADPEAFAEHPIGNGPFVFGSRQPDVKIGLRRWDDYRGVDKPTIEGVDFVNYEKSESAYEAVNGGDLDYLDQAPPSALADGEWKADLGDRTVDAPGFLNMSLTFPTYRPEYANPDLRKAISMAINRPLIADKIYEGSRTPAKGWVPDSMPGYRTGACGKYCEFHPDEAKRLFDATGHRGPIVISSNADGGHKEWIDAACGNIAQTLGVQCSFAPTPTFSEFRTKSTTKQHTGPFRVSWNADYPSAESFLAKVYSSNGSSNDSGYANPEFDAALQRAAEAPNVDEANERYREAEQILAEDMPSAPIFDTGSQSAHSDRISNVHTTPYRELDLASVRLNDDATP